MATLGRALRTEGQGQPELAQLSTSRRFLVAGQPGPQGCLWGVWDLMPVACCEVFADMELSHIHVESVTVYLDFLLFTLHRHTCRRMFCFCSFLIMCVHVGICMRVHVPSGAVASDFSGAGVTGS